MTIDWKPIADMPENRRDGRPVLLWSRYGQAVIASFEDERWSTGRFSEYDPSGGYEPSSFVPEEIGEVTHYADINPPE